MTVKKLAPFESTLRTTNIWLKEIEERLGWIDRHLACQALQSVLHALRDRLTPEGVAALGAQLPLLIRGLYYETWHPAGKPLKERKKEEFLAHIAADFAHNSVAEPETIARAVFAVLAKHVSPGEIDAIKRVWPPELRSLLP